MQFEEDKSAEEQRVKGGDERSGNGEEGDIHE
jgi:hypothetical protein